MILIMPFDRNTSVILYKSSNKIRIANLEKGGNSNSSAKAAEDVSEEILVAMLEHSANGVQKSSVGWSVVVPAVVSFQDKFNNISIQF